MISASSGRRRAELAERQPRNDLLRSRRNRFVHDLLQSRDPFAGVMHFVNAIQTRSFQRWLIQVHVRVQPGQVLRDPFLFDVGGSLSSVRQQKFSESLTSPILRL
jgi:hypothetical protein